jgi:hypothetical protein
LHLATLADIYRDLLSLSQEFDTMDWDVRQETLSVHTEPITLSDVELGPFEIELNLNAIPHHNCYRVVALEPLRAASNDSVTHPHVMHDRLCEGEGRLSIRRALHAGRIADFFMLVTNLLGTYNSGSPYVTLDDWFGVRCVDCGSVTSEDDRYTCERCDSDVCSYCSGMCHHCESSFCSSCLSPCGDCEENFCTHCLKTCRACNELFCKGCLENQLCGTCRQLQEDDEHEYDDEIDDAPAMEDAEQPPAVPALQPDGLGEALVPA